MALDCMDVRNYNLPVRQEAYDLPPGDSPCDNPGALWIIATDILTEDVCYNDLLGMMNNVSRIPVTRTPAERTCTSLSWSIPAGDPHGV